MSILLAHEICFLVNVTICKLGLTLLIGSRSPKDIQLSWLNKKYICASLERMKPMA